MLISWNDANALARSDSVNFSRMRRFDALAPAGAMAPITA